MAETEWRETEQILSQLRRKDAHIENCVNVHYDLCLIVPLPWLNTF